MGVLHAAQPDYVYNLAAMSLVSTAAANAARADLATALGPVDVIADSLLAARFTEVCAGSAVAIIRAHSLPPTWSNCGWAPVRQTSCAHPTPTRNNCAQR